MRVLLVEDEYLIALDAEQMLRELGAQSVEIISTFDGAYKRTQNGQFDVAVLDVRLPDGNGIELCRDLLSRLPDLPARPGFDRAGIEEVSGEEIGRAHV